MYSQTYLPRKDAELLSWCNNFTAIVTANAESWEIPTTEVTNLQSKLSDFESLIAKAKSPARSSIIVTEKNESRKALVATIRELVNFRLKNPVISDSQLVTLGLRPRDRTKTLSPAPVTYPELQIDRSVMRQLTVHYRDTGSERKAKPAGVHGVEIRWSILSVPPTSVDNLITSSFSTKTPFVMSFNEDDRGKWVYFCARWENNRGEKGPWSEIVGTVIP